MTLTTPRSQPRPDVIQPTDDAYDAARAAWNLRADQRPAGVAHATTTQHVQEALAYAREHGLRVAPQVTGHLAGAFPSLEDALLLKLALHDEVAIDPVARRARVKAGAAWEDVVAAAAPHGLAAPHGSAPDVGVIGYLVGGGLSWYGRRLGVAANHVRSVEIVTADGELRRVDAASEPDLFWAVRGGGSSFGVVTEVEIDLFETAEVFAGATFWPVAQAPAVLRAWLDWTRTAPAAITTSARIHCQPPLPEVPEPLRAVPVVTVDGVLSEDVGAGEALVAAFRSVGAPVMDQWGVMPAAGIARLHGDPEVPVPGIGDHTLLEDLDESALDAFLAVTGDGSGSPLLAAELRQLGGALAEAPAGAGARGRLEGAFALFAVGAPMVPELAEPIGERLAMLREAMRPWETGTVFLNFDENPEATGERAFAPEDYARLREVRAAYDPQELFVAPQRIEPAGG